MYTVSSRGDRCRFINAIWYSYSKSLTAARRPRDQQVRLLLRRELDEQAAEALDNPRASRRQTAERMRPERASSTVNKGFFRRVRRHGGRSADRRTRDFD